MYDLVLPSLTPNIGDNGAVSTATWRHAGRASLHTVGSLPPVPPAADGSLTWCPRVHDGKHINSYGSSIKHWKCAETVGHRIFLHRNGGEKETLAGFSNRLMSARTAMMKTRASKSVPGRWSFWVDGEERMVTGLVIPESTLLVLASTSALGKLDTLNGNHRDRLYFQVDCRPAGWPGGRFLPVSVFLPILSERWGVPFTQHNWKAPSRTGLWYFWSRATSTSATRPLQNLIPNLSVLTETAWHFPPANRNVWHIECLAIWNR